MTKIIREILVLPLRILLLVTRFLPIVDQYTLVKWIWKIARTTEDGFKLVSLTVNKEGLQAGRDLAREILEETKSALIAYAIAWHEIANMNYQEAKTWVDLAEEVGCDDLHHILIIKLHCTRHLDDYDFRSVVDEMVSCNCLSMEHTREALLAKVHILINNEEFDKAEQISDRLLAVKEDNVARYLKGMTCLYLGKDDMAQKQFIKSKGSVSDEQHYAAIGRVYLSCDRVQEGMEWIYKAVGAGFEVSNEDEYLWDFIHSKEFADYCAIRD